jgi:hypothetical protein
MGDSIRELLESNVTAAETASNAAPTPPAPGPAASAPAAPTPPAPVTGAPAPTPVDPAATPAAPTPPAPEGTAPKPEDDKTKHNLGTAIAAKPPGTWTPAAREHWANLPDGVREEIIKRERETSRVMTQSASARKFVNDFQQVIHPHLAQIQAEGGNPLQTIQGMFNIGTTLRTGAPQTKAQMMANLCKQFGIDLNMLDEQLAVIYNGAAPGQAQPPAFNPDLIRHEVQRAIAPLVQSRQQEQQQMLQQIEAEVDSELADFASKNEFYEDVKSEMADLMEMAQRRGVKMSLTEAYERATLLSAPVRAVMEQRKTVSIGQQAHQVAQQAKAGAFGVKPSADTGVTNLPAGDSIRDCLERSFVHHSGRV